VRLILEVDDNAAARLDALNVFDGFDRPSDWKCNYGWCVSREGRDYWIKKTKTGYSVRQINK